MGLKQLCKTFVVFVVLGTVGWLVLHYTLADAAGFSSPSKIPDPMVDFTKCGLSQPGHVCDPNGMLDDPGAIAARVEDIERTVVSPCGEGHREEGTGPQIAVVLVHHMSGGNTIDDAKRMARGIHDLWGVGHAKCQDGIVLFMSINDRHLWFSTGAGVKHLVTDDVVTHIFSQIMKPKLKAGKVQEAVELALAALEDVMVSGEDSQTYQDATRVDWAGILIIAGIVGVFGIVLVCVLRNDCRRRRSYNECLERLRAIESMRDSNDFRDNATLCPVCLDAFPTEANPSNDVRPLTLQCGHKFCEGCIVEWLKTNNTCPVCRAPTDVGPNLTQRPGSDAPPPTSPTSATRRGPHANRTNGSGSGSGSGGGGGSFFWGGGPSTTRSSSRWTGGGSTHGDLEFYLMSMNRRYPSYVSQSRVREWSNPTFSRPMSTCSSFTSLNPSLPSRSSGGGGGGSSWGGGSSFGGGGGGGSW